MKRALSTAVLLCCPAAAHACAVCFSATEQNRVAFLVTTIVLSLLPLGLIGGGLLWLRRQARLMFEEQGSAGGGESSRTELQGHRPFSEAIEQA